MHLPAGCRAAEWHRNDPIEVLQSASRVKGEGDYAKAITLYEPAAEFIAQRPKCRSFGGAYILSDVRLDIAEAMALGQIGYLSAQREQGRALLVQ